MNIFSLWEDDQFTISTPKNPHVPYSEGSHIIVAPKQEIATAWQDVDLSEATFKLTATACKINDPMPEADRTKLIDAFKSLLSA